MALPALPNVPADAERGYAADIGRNIEARPAPAVARSLAEDHVVTKVRWMNFKPTTTV